MRKTFLFLLLATGFAGVNAQDFEPLDRKYYPDKYELVDTILMGNKKLGTYPKAGDVYYIQDLGGPSVNAGFNGGFGAMTVTKTVNGKKWEYIPYDYPALCYIASKLPGGAGDFYGFYTTGFEKTDKMLAGEPQKNPYSRPGIIYGTVVRPDGERETYLVRPEAEWKKLAVSKPTGTFYIHDFSEDFKALEITFNAGGTGKIVYHLPRTEHQAPQEIAGMSTQRRSNGTVKKRHRSFTGGYHFYMDGTISTPMKWTYKDGKLDVTPTGKPTTNVSGGIDYEKTWAKHSVTASDKAIENGKYRADFPTNEYVVEAKKATKATVDAYAAHLEALGFPVVHMTQKEILVGLDSKNFPGKFYYMMDRNKTSDPIMGYCLDVLSGIFDKFAATRTPGHARLFNNFTSNAKIGIAMAGEPLRGCLYYKVSDINPAERTAKVDFLVPGKEYTADLRFDQKWHVDNALLQSSLKEDSGIAEKRALIAANDAKILEYKKDKRRAKIVKNYEKQVKNMKQPETFNTLNEYAELCRLQDRLLKIQEETLIALE